MLAFLIFLKNSKRKAEEEKKREMNFSNNQILSRRMKNKE